MSNSRKRRWLEIVSETCAGIEGGESAKELLDLRWEEFEAEIAALANEVGGELQRRAQLCQQRLAQIKAEEQSKINAAREEAQRKLEAEKAAVEAESEALERGFERRGAEAKERFVREVDAIITGSERLDRGAREILEAAMARAFKG